jgi:hypothetical protein
MTRLPSNPTEVSAGASAASSGKAAPRVQVERIAANLDPGLLLEDFHSLDRGAPIIGQDKAVESGNGRVMAIARAARLHPDVMTATSSRSL